MLRFLALALLVALPTSALGQTSPPALELDADALADIRPAMQRYVDDGALAGMVTLVAHRGEVIHLEAVGALDREAGTAMPTDALFRIASMTKPIVSTAVLMLYDDGRLDLDDPVADHLSAFADVQVFAGTAPDGTLTLDAPERPVTIRHLLTHTAGIASSMFGATPVNARYREANPVGGSASVAEEAAAIATLPLQHQPGAAWTYGLSTDVLAHVIETVTGQTLQQVLRERLFEPLGMEDTDYVVAADRMDRFATLYGHDRDGRLGRVQGPEESPNARPTTFFRGNTGLVTTARDYARFAQMLLEGGALDGVRILRPETAALMRTNHLPPSLLPMRVGALDYPGAGHGFGLGLGIVLDPEAAGLPVSPGTLWWVGSVDTYFWIDPEREVVGVLMTQLADMELHPYYPDFLQRVYAALPTAPPVPAGTSAAGRTER